MRVVLQRVSSASVSVEGKITGSIDSGLLILVGFGKDDHPDILPSAVKKISELRIFNDANGKINRSLLDIGGAVLVVSQFTLYANCTRGRRPDFIDAALPDAANRLYHEFLDAFRSANISTQAGIFGADMQVALVNDGPVTIILDF